MVVVAQAFQITLRQWGSLLCDLIASCRSRRNSLNHLVIESVTTNRINIFQITIHA